MKKSYKIILVVSLLLNTFFLVAYLMHARASSFGFSSSRLNEVNIDSARKTFIRELKTKFPQLASKKYYFINIWSAGDWDSMKRMPKLDTLVEPLRNDMAYVFVCDEKTDYAWRKLKEHTSKAENFVYLNDQKNFAVSIYQELKILNRKPYKWNYPCVSLVLNNHGKIVFAKLYPHFYGKIDLPKGKTFQLTEKERDIEYYHSIDSVLNALK